MITVERLTRDDGTQYDEYRGLPSDPRPEDANVGDIFVEIRTGKQWKWTGSNWDRIEYQPVSAPVDDVLTEDSTKSLSAKQGKLLNDRMNNLSNIGRFLALWNCETGLPTTNPVSIPYTYHTGDYFRVSILPQSGSCYKPDGTSYVGTASTTVETGPVSSGDIYYFDGTTWSLQINHEIRPVATTVNIAVADWNSGTTVTKEVTGVTTSNIVIVDPSDPSVECTAQGNNSLTFTAEETPTEAVTVKVVIV